jgi:hypothetical protein
VGGDPTGLRVAADRVDPGRWVVVRAGVLLEVDAGGHGALAQVGAVSRREEHLVGQQAARASPQELAVLVIEDDQADVLVLEVRGEVAGDGLSGRYPGEQTYDQDQYEKRSAHACLRSDRLSAS